jgi:hypothetical protein
VLLAKSGLVSFGSFTSSAELWLSRVNWEVIGYVVLGLVVFQIVAWAFTIRR